jgi:uncharacterized membrane protein YgcG
MKQQPMKWRIPAALLAGVTLTLGMLSPLEAAAIDATDSLIVDDAGLLTDAEEASLTQDIQDTADTIDMNILVYVSGTRVSRSQTQNYCESLCAQTFDMDEDSVVYYMDLSGHTDLSYSPYDFIYTRHLARFYYTDESYGGSNRIDRIFESLDPFLTRGEEDIPDAVDEFLYMLEYYYAGGADEDYYYYVPDTGMYMVFDPYEEEEYAVYDKPDGMSTASAYGLACLISFGIALIISIITFFGIRSHYRFKTAPSSLAYLSIPQMRMGPRVDRLIGTRHTRTVHVENHSGGGGGGFHGTSSGGGGGGHSR